MKKYDVIVLGFGKAGKTLAAKLATQGKSVAMVEEDDKMYGEHVSTLDVFLQKRF